jgi:hypothetical protein
VRTSRPLFFLAIVLLATVICNAQSTLPLKNARDLVEAEYLVLQTLNRSDRALALATVPSDMQDDLWVFHVANFLNGEQNLTAIQRSVLLEAIGFLATGSRQAAVRGDQSALDAGRALVSRAQQLLPRDLARQALAAFGPDAKSSTTDWSIDGTVAPLVEEENTCSCSVDSDFCSYEPGEICAATIPMCTLVRGCGLFWLYLCDGKCEDLPPPPQP